VPSGADRRAALVDRARARWAGLAGTPSFPRSGRSVVVAPGSKLCPPGWVGAVAIAGAALVTVPDVRAAAAVHRDLTGDPTDPAAWRRAMPVVEALGPATLAYLDERDFTGAEVGGPAVERGDPAALLAATDPDEAGESGLAEISSPAYVIRAGDRVLAAAGYAVWPGRTAHLCVLTAADARGRGLARAAAAAAVADALGTGLLPQWRARPEASRRVARALGFRELGTQLSVRLGGEG
jgi:hypothetical protein